MSEFVMVDQGTAEWFQLRLGKLTASRMKDALSFLKNGEPSEARNKYKVELVCERLTERMAEHYVSPAMQWGTQTEDLAKAAYLVETGNDVIPVGIALHPEIPDMAASPDGAVDEYGLVECKCPNTSTHLRWMLDGVIPKEHRLQILTQLACCPKRKWVDFVSFDPRLPERHQLFIKRMDRAEGEIAEIEKGGIRFLDEVAAMIADLDRINPYIAPAPQDEPDDMAWAEGAKLLHEDIDRFIV